MTFSLCGELGPRIEPGRGIDNFADPITAALDSRGLERAIVCGISFEAWPRYVSRRSGRNGRRHSCSLRLRDPAST